MTTKLTLSATAREIINALRQNKMIIGHFVEDGVEERYLPFTVINFSESDEGRFFNIDFGNDGVGAFSTDNLDDYPYYIFNDSNNLPA